MNMPNESPNHQSNAGHETLAVSVRPVVGWLIALAILVLVTLALMEWLMMHFAYSESGAKVRPAGGKLPIAHEFPLLDERQSQELLQTRDLAHQLLSEYTWVDRQAGVARIPIGRAMDILAQRGLPDVGQPTTGGGQP
jgi:hypothetical protein